MRGETDVSCVCSALKQTPTSPCTQRVGRVFQSPHWIHSVGSRRHAVTRSKRPSRRRFSSAERCKGCAFRIVGPGRKWHWLKCHFPGSIGWTQRNLPSPLPPARGGRASSGWWARRGRHRHRDVTSMGAKERSLRRAARGSRPGPSRGGSHYVAVNGPMAGTIHLLSPGRGTVRDGVKRIRRNEGGFPPWQSWWRRRA